MKINLHELYNINFNEFSLINSKIEKFGVSIFGAGFQGSFILEYLLSKDVKVNYFVDSDNTKVGRKINGIEVLSPTNNILDKDSILLISSFNYVDDIIKSNIDKYTYIIPFFKWLFIKEFNNFLSVRELFEDDTSKEIYDNLMYAKFTGNVTLMSNLYSGSSYFSFSKCLPNNRDEIFLDAGAYVGDTLEKFINKSEGNFRKIYAFEPGELQFKAIRKRTNRLIEEWALCENSIVLEKLGLSNENKTVYFNSDTSILAANIISTEKTNNKIDIVSIDNYLEGSPITFLKADIEGEELNMLKGAMTTIKKYTPKIVLSIYHRPEDFITIPIFIKSIYSGYKFSLRHHSNNFTESVLYCYI